MRDSARTMLLQLKVQNCFDQEADGLDKAALEQLIRAHHGEFAFCDEAELAAFATQAWEDAQPSTVRALYRPLSHEAFREWYEQFLEFLESEKVSPTMRTGDEADVSAAGWSPFASDAPWTVPMAQMQDALDAAWSKGRTPLLVDMTADGGDSTPLETFYAYSGDKLIDLKRLVVQVDITKEKSREDALSEMRAKLVLCMRRGYHLVVFLGDAAPRVRSRYSSPTHLPYELFEANTEVQRVVGMHAEDWRRVAWSRALLTEADQIQVVHKDFNVIVVTRLAPSKYCTYLSKEWPLSSMQHIKVTKA